MESTAVIRPSSRPFSRGGQCFLVAIFVFEEIRARQRYPYLSAFKRFCPIHPCIRRLKVTEITHDQCAGENRYASASGRCATASCVRESSTRRAVRAVKQPMGTAGAGFGILAIRAPRERVDRVGKFQCSERVCKPARKNACASSAHCLSGPNGSANSQAAIASPLIAPVGDALKQVGGNFDKPNRRSGGIIEIRRCV